MQNSKERLAPLRYLEALTAEIFYKQGEKADMIFDKTRYNILILRNSGLFLHESPSKDFYLFGSLRLSERLSKRTVIPAENGPFSNTTHFLRHILYFC